MVAPLIVASIHRFVVSFYLEFFSSCLVCMFSLSPATTACVCVCLCDAIVSWMETSVWWDEDGETKRNNKCTQFSIWKPLLLRTGNHHFHRHRHCSLLFCKWNKCVFFVLSFFTFRVTYELDSNFVSMIFNAKLKQWSSVLVWVNSFRLDYFVYCLKFERKISTALDFQFKGNERRRTLSIELMFLRAIYCKT